MNNALYAIEEIERSGPSMVPVWVAAVIFLILMAVWIYVVVHIEDFFGED